MSDYREKWCRYGNGGRGHYVPETDGRSEVVQGKGKTLRFWICGSCQMKRKPPSQVSDSAEN